MNVEYFSKAHGKGAGGGGALKRKKETVLQRKQWLLSMQAAAGHLADRLGQDVLLILDPDGEESWPCSIALQAP